MQSFGFTERQISRVRFVHEHGREVPLSHNKKGALNYFFLDFSQAGGISTKEEEYTKIMAKRNKNSCTRVQKHGKYRTFGMQNLFFG
jgi:hypothetical protein